MGERFQNMGFPANARQDGGKETEHGTDTVLNPGFSSIPYVSLPGSKRKRNMVEGSLCHHFGSSLSLGLGCSSNSSDSNGSVTAACSPISPAKKTDEESSRDVVLDCDLHLGNCKLLNSETCTGLTSRVLHLQPEVNLDLSLCTGPSESEITSVHQISSPLQPGGAQSADEASTSRLRRLAFRRPSLQISQGISLFSKEVPRTNGPIVGPELFSGMAGSLVPLTSRMNIQPQAKKRSSSFKICWIEGCGKRARGASGLCISHGGGTRCQRPDCPNGAEGRTMYCKAHGGGRRCDNFGCTKSAEGRTDKCIRHGGGRRCSHKGCTKAARGKSGLCIGHGGGKRCQKENCSRSAEGISGLCISHGGGKRCQFIDCTKGAQGSTMFCKKHGGGRRCTHPECTKGAEGSTGFCKAHGGGKRCAFQGDAVCPKSVHGGTNFCVSHGGGKRCAFPKCSTGARGKTPFCVRHGGGKRCVSQGCDKSAQGSTNLCKAHGGGKRCSWGRHGSKYGDQSESPCNSAGAKLGLCLHHRNIVEDKRVHGGTTSLWPAKMKGVVIADENSDVGVMKNRGTLPSKPEKLKGIVIADENSDDDDVVKISRTLAGWKLPSANPVSAPEGRVRGGNMMAKFLDSSSSIGSSSSFTMPRGGFESLFCARCNRPLRSDYHLPFCVCDLG